MGEFSTLRKHPGMIAQWVKYLTHYLKVAGTANCPSGEFLPLTCDACENSSLWL